MGFADKPARRPGARLSLRLMGKLTTYMGNGIATDMTKAAFLTTLEDILGVAPGALKTTDTRESVPGWSSLTDVTILTVIFSELGIEAEEDLLDYESVGDLLDILERRNAFAPS
jgi:acyl carrier protein